MHNDPLLTQTELDFIQKLSSQPRSPQPAGDLPQLAIGEQLSELLSHLADHEQLSIDTHSDSEHLSFPLHLIKEDRSHARLELGPPLIFEQGEVERPWRLVLSSPLTLLDSRDRPSGLSALELSNNGMLVEHHGKNSPAKDRLLQLLLPDSAAYSCAHGWPGASARTATPIACSHCMPKTNRICVSTCSNSTAPGNARQQL